ncbi:MAG: hypothetical protein ACTHZI_12375 [Luteimonas sp.]
MRNTGQICFAIPLALTLALAACGGSAPDDASEPTPVAVEPEVGQAPPQPAEAAPVPDPAAAMPQVPTDEHGMVQPWAIAAQMGGSLQALGEGCGIEDKAGFEHMDAGSRRELEALGADMEAFEALWKQTHASAKREFDAGTAEQRAQACAELEELRLMSEQYAEGMPQS